MKKGGNTQFVRSTDYGATYEKLNDKVGLKTVLSYLYVCPSNKRKIMLLSDPEIESSLLISSDEGASYQKFRLNFYILSLLFHPRHEDWILAYSHDQKLYSSIDFGRKWHLVHENVNPNRFYWSVIGLDKESDLIHMEARTADGHARYISCRIQACSELDRSHPFPGFIDTSSLVVQDDYMFIQVTTGGRATYYVSYRREPFIQIKLPKYALPKDMHIVSTDENQVFAAVQEWYQNDTYNLYISETRGIYFTLALEHVKTSRGLEGNIMIDLYEVAGIKGMFLANKKLEGQVKTYITYNKGRDWRLLKAPVTDLKGNPIHCVLPFCSLHLHLQVSENPYTSGSISSKASAPGIIVATGNIGAELTFSNVGMFISTDAGNSWQQIFEEEHSIWFLDKGGALIAVKQTSLPIRQLAFFGHFSHRSEWQLVKIDYKSIFSRRCTEGDYQTWHLNNQGEPCVMGEKQIYMKRRPGNHCMLGKDYSRMLSSEPCICAASDFECDYGYERRGDGKCLPAFWFNPTTVSRSCSLGQSYLNSTGYRKVVSNNCTAGVKEIYTARKQQCPRRAPRGLHVVTSDGKLVSSQGSNVTFLVFLEDGDSLRTNIQLDFGDGIAVSYSNLSLIEGGVKHVYKTAGIFRVCALAENSLGSDSAVLYLHITLITLEGSVSYTFTMEGMNTVTVQVSAGDAILQDTKTIAVHEFFKSLLLSFSPNLDEYNPDIHEWRDDVSKVIKKALVQVSDFPEEQLLVAVLPGIPTAAELFLLPHNNRTEGRKKNEADLEQISGILVSTLNQNVVEFELKPGVGVIVYITQLTLEHPNQNITQSFTLTIKNITQPFTLPNQNITQPITLPNQNITQPITLPNQNITQLITLSIENITQLFTLPNQNITQLFKLLNQNITQLFKLPNQNITQLFKLPNQNITQPITLPNQNITQPITLPNQNITQLITLSIENITQLFTLPNQNITQLFTLPNQNITQLFKLLNQNITQLFKLPNQNITQLSTLLIENITQPFTLTIENITALHTDH
ncbi:UNVERIFIED_CONTAM: hypothetical protein FKN15_011935 [Acipenser sinensis]